MPQDRPISLRQIGANCALAVLTASGAGNARLPNPKPLVIALSFCRVPWSVGSYKTASIFSKSTKNLDMYLSVDSQGPLASRYCYFYTRFGKILQNFLQNLCLQAIVHHIRVVSSFSLLENLVGRIKKSDSMS